MQVLALAFGTLAVCSSVHSESGSLSLKQKAHSSNPDADLSTTLPPPYSVGIPEPDNPGTYGDYGPYRNGWNGQYYPYASYGYGDLLDLGLDVAPYYLAGPYGFYGPYGSGPNVTVSQLYVNGSEANNGTSVNGTLFYVEFADGQYTLYEVRGSYFNGIVFEDTESGTLDNPVFRVAFNGTFKDPLAEARKTVINPNLTANGSVLHTTNHSLVQGNAAQSSTTKSSSSKSAASTPDWKWAPIAFGFAAMML